MDIASLVLDLTTTYSVLHHLQHENIFLLIAVGLKILYLCGTLTPLSTTDTRYSCRPMTACIARYMYRNACRVADVRSFFCHLHTDYDPIHVNLEFIQVQLPVPMLTLAKELFPFSWMTSDALILRAGL